MVNSYEGPEIFDSLNFIGWLAKPEAVAKLVEMLGSSGFDERCKNELGIARWYVEHRTSAGAIKIKEFCDLTRVCELAVPGSIEMTVGAKALLDILGYPK